MPLWKFSGKGHDGVTCSPCWQKEVWLRSFEMGIVAWQHYLCFSIALCASLHALH